MKDILAPHQRYFHATPGDTINLWEYDWLRNLVWSNRNRMLDIWDIEGGNWRLYTAGSASVVARETCPVVLIRLAPPGPVLCVGLGQELTLIEQLQSLERGEAPTYVDLRQPGANNMRLLRVHAWRPVRPYDMMMLARDRHSQTID